MTDATSYARSHTERFREELFEYLSIPSVSTDPGRAGDVRRCAEWVAGTVRDAGLDVVELEQTAGHPIVLGEHEVDPDAPTVLVYGHYDVQPTDPEELWETPPFEPTERDGRVYARGATDNKGQNHMHLKALESCLRSDDGSSVNLKLVIEGEEEIGSEHLEGFLTENQGRLACDAIVLSDTGMFAPDIPSITVGLRGIVYFQVTLRGPATDLHSGVYGGPIVNPANALGEVIAALVDDRGRVTVPGFYDRVRPITEEERERLAALPFDPEEFMEEAGVTAFGGEEGYGPMELTGFRPTLDVNGLLAGFTGEGAKTVLPARAMAKISMRLVPDQDPAEIAESFRSWIHELAPEGVEAEILTYEEGWPWAADPEGPFFTVAARALERAFGREPVFVREGGSIPILPLFAETFEAPVLPIGFALPGAGQHAPNEWMDLGVYDRGLEALAEFYARAGSDLRA